MATTVQDIIDLANSKSMKNRPGVTATPSELFEVIIKAQRKLFSLAARINPTFFGASETVTFDTGWPRPADAESVTRIEAGADTMNGATPAVQIAAGTKIEVVPDDDRRANRFGPSVYRYGQKYYSAGNTIDPAAGSLVFFFSKRPDDPETISDELDEMWPEQYNELLALESALYLALKDSATNRGDEFVALRAERDEILKLFIAFLEHEDSGETRRWGHLRLINTQSMIPLSTFLAGGTSLFPTPSSINRE